MTGNEQRRPREGGEEAFGGAEVSLPDRPVAVGDLASLRAAVGAHARRVVEEALLSALPASWLRRAAAFEAARPRPGDFNGQAGAADLAARDRRCAEAAQACRERAELLARHGDILGVEVASAVSEGVAA